jgi:hypothetical protein
MRSSPLGRIYCISEPKTLSAADVGDPQRFQLLFGIPDLTEQMLGLTFRARVLTVLAGFGTGRARERTGDVELVAGQVPPDPPHFLFHGLGLLFVLDEFDNRKAVDAGESGGRYGGSSCIEARRDQECACKGKSAAKIRVFCIEAILLLKIEIGALRLVVTLPRFWPFSNLYVRYQT